MKIVLICYAGMSTSLLVNRMKKVAVERALTTEIEAYSASEIHEVLDDASVILLGPQARYALDEVKSIAGPKHIPVDVIDNLMYGTMNAEGVLDKALAMLKA